MKVERERRLIDLKSKSNAKRASISGHILGWIENDNLVTLRNLIK